MKRIFIYDTTLRDGAQGLGISFTVEDKLKIVRKLDDLGVAYIEAGNPGSNPKDMEFYEHAARIRLKNARLVAFGSTRRMNIAAEDDDNLKSLLKAKTDVVTVFGKTWDFQVTDILKTTLEENLKMISDTVKFFKDAGKEVIYDAEHFFDGFIGNEAYALKTLTAAAEAGADSICLCDTRGGIFPSTIEKVVAKVGQTVSQPLGIHCHNDTGMGVACSISAVQSGAVMVQGTINGLGERCGNANLCSIIPNLQLLGDYACIPEECMHMMTPISRSISEIANISHDETQPYVGGAAFAHKGGMHMDAVRKSTSAYELFDPSIVGNQRVFLLSEVAGRSAILKKINEIDSTITKDSPEASLILEKLKEMEAKGYQYEGAEGSFELLVKKILGCYAPSFELKEFKVIVNEPPVNEVNSSAMIKIHVGDQIEITAAEGEGPVNALDKALRKALERFYPDIRSIKLTDYKVRVLNSTSATASKVRVLIETSDGTNTWTTIGVSTDIIEASWIALVDSIEHRLLSN
ncbi:MAG: citramalate synthase [Clostridiales bacterium]|nr:citramalate synthase [Clostridiales bacterium]